MREDPFGGIVDSSERHRLQKALLEPFDIELHPSKRSIQHLADALDRAYKLITAGGVEWSGSQSSHASDDSEGRLNALLALLNHLSWLVDVFREHPGVSVSIR
jgi:hypothetical protein